MINLNAGNVVGKASFVFSIILAFLTWHILNLYAKTENKYLLGMSLGLLLVLLIFLIWLVFLDARKENMFLRKLIEYEPLLKQYLNNQILLQQEEIGIKPAKQVRQKKKK